MKKKKRVQIIHFCTSQLTISHVGHYPLNTIKAKDVSHTHAKRHRRKKKDSRKKISRLFPCQTPSPANNRFLVVSSARTSMCFVQVKLTYPVLYHLKTLSDAKKDMFSSCFIKHVIIYRANINGIFNLNYLT